MDYLLKYKEDLSPYLRTCKTLQLGPDFLFPQEMYPGDEETTPCSTVVDYSDEPAMSGSSGSSGSTEVNNANFGNFLGKKRSGIYVGAGPASKVSSYEDDMAVSCMSRRKGTPHRSPFC